jgi:hypothetical protein
MTTRKNHGNRKSLRQIAAKKRLNDWQALSPAEQLALLDTRLGVGKGAQRQRARLAQ